MIRTKKWGSQADRLPTPASDAPAARQSTDTRPRIALVIQRFGAEVNGGAEHHARMLARALAPRYRIDVLTSCARDHANWASFYPPGETELEGLTIRRFAHPLRNDEGRAKVPRRHKLRFLLRGVWPAPRVARPSGHAAADGERFLRLQGPHCPELLAALARERNDYAAAIFFTALYEPTALGIQAWGKRSILVPLLHDEKEAYLPFFRRVYRSAGWIMFNTAAEQRLAASLYGRDAVEHGEVCGSGIDATPPPADAPDVVREKFDLGESPYLLYLGRIGKDKGCGELVRSFARVRRRHPEAKLVLAGRGTLAEAVRPGVVPAGFVNLADRDALIAGAAAVVVPSRYESLSLVLLEAMSLGTPVVANARCAVLADHLRVSHAGFAYRGARGLDTALAGMLELGADERARFAALGRDYVRDRYGWPAIVAKYVRAIERVGAAAVSGG